MVVEDEFNVVVSLQMISSLSSWRKNKHKQQQQQLLFTDSKKYLKKNTQKTDS